MEYDVPLLKDTTASVKLLGLEALLVPFLQFISSQRVSMFSSQIVQALPPWHAEQPFIYTGYENIIGKYSFNSTERDQDMYILAVIPKYLENRGIKPLKYNPRYTVIYIGREDGMVHYFHLDKFTKGTDGYGYENVIMNRSMLKPDLIVPKEIEFSKSPSHIGANGYGMGVNANVAYLTLPEVNNDAFLISERLAEKLTTTSICTIAVDIKANQVPLNLYGDDEEHKFLPDIGEFVRDDGIICGFRTPTDSTFVSDMMSLSTPHVLHDDLYYAPPGSQIIDVDFYVGQGRNRVRTDRALYAQVDKYLQPMNTYWTNVIKCYEKVKERNIPLSPEFNTFVTRAMAMSIASGIRVPGIQRKQDIKLCKGKERIEFIYMKITYAFTRKVNNAFKLSDRNGGKGVVSQIRKTEEMPTDDFGITADIVIDPQSVPNRMNPSQEYETGINRISVFVQRQAIQLRKTQGDTAAMDYVLDYIREIHPAYADMIVSPRAHNNPEYFLDTIEKAELNGDVGIYLMIPPFLKTIGPELIQRLAEKYHVQGSPVTFYPLDKDGNPYRSRTKCEVNIGAKYMYLLYKVPHAKAPGVAYINQFKVPVKPSQHARLMSLIGQTPLRIGEDETRIGTMCAGADAVVRLMGLHANSFESVKLMCNTLLRAKDTNRIERIDVTTKQIQQTNNIIGVSKHMMSTMGINMDNIDCEPFNEAKFIADLKS